MKINALRTNLRFTDTYSHLMSQSIANVLKKTPGYDVIKYLLIMEQAKCEGTIDPNDLKIINRLIPGANFNDNIGNNSNLERETPLLYQFSKIAGLSPKDWTMTFQEKTNSDYNSAMPNDPSFGDDLRIHSVVGGEMLKDISQTNPVIANASKNQISRGVEEFFGENFSCIDDLGGGIRSQSFQNNSLLCEQLKIEHKKNITTLEKNQIDCIDCKENQPLIQKPILPEAVETIMTKFSSEQIARGKKLIEADSKGKCVTCHSANSDELPTSFRFISSTHDTKEKKQESLAILTTRKNEMPTLIEKYLIKKKLMPPEEVETDLSNQDREDIKAYIINLATGNK